MGVLARVVDVKAVARDIAEELYLGERELQREDYDSYRDYRRALAVYNARIGWSQSHVSNQPFKF
eukprot:COSAG02_NODE_2438_length_8864_cov_23.127781_7_plen_65_part_00